jgi:alkanesulfonate monooxygenase SsuD/methylene tetrahydromethanopterin reductase-like flavin-dependent oxidoreductase (luciferase family)
MTRIMASKSGLTSGGNTIEGLMEKGFVVVGSPATVRDQIATAQQELGFGTLCGNFQFGTLGHEKFLSNVALFSEQVMPSLRPLGTTQPPVPEGAGAGAA